MALKDILVHLDGGRGQAVRLRLAAELARQHGAHLIGLYGVEVTPITAIAVPGMGSYADAQAMQVAVRAAREEADSAETGIEAVFRTALESAGVTGEWRAVARGAAESVTEHARYVDLAIIGQTDPEDAATAENAGLPESVLTGSGRPVLFVPYVGKFATLGKRVLIAWNATREAARAIGDALPLLADAERVTVLTVGRSSEDESNEDTPAAQLVEHLARHGISAEASALVAHDLSVGDLVLSRAADLGADLIVMGGYGHSPTRELLLGGATRSLLQHMTVPVLMSH